MTRAYVYGIALAAFVAATGMTLASIFLPSWITWDAPALIGHYSRTIGLHKSCTTVDSITACYDFPSNFDCQASDRYFCSMWRSVGFMMLFSVALELATLVAFVVLIVGGKQKRETGWRIVVYLLLLVGGLQCAGMSIVAYLFDNDDRFFAGWELGTGFTLCTISWCTAIFTAVSLTLSALLFPEEGGYELIPSERRGW